MIEHNSLPESWAWARLRDVASQGRSRNPKVGGEGEFLYVDIQAVDNTAQRITSPKRTRNSDAPSRARVEIKSGDVLFSLVRPYLKNIARVPPELDGQIASTAYCLLRPETDILGSFLFYYLTQESFINALPTYGNSPPAARDEEFYDMAVPVPPPAEQRRIVAAIEEQFSRVDAGVAALKRVRANLKRYRTTVLKAAVEGRLTEAWREENPDVEPVSQLLERILKERRERWEKNQLARYVKKGKNPPKNWRSKYKEPAGPNTEGLSGLPEGWCWINLDAVLSGITAGKSFKCEERPPERDEVGVVKVSAVTWGEFNELESKTNTDPARFDPELLIHEGDFLFSRANTIALVGACVIVRQVRSSLMLSDKILRFTIVRLPYNWLLLALRTRHGRNEIERLATGNQDSMRNISQENIRRIRIPLPPLQEQVKIIAEVERRLSVLQEVEAAVEANLKRALRVRQTILKWAFEGKLVAQDPSDEPVTSLLARVRAGKAQREQEARQKTQRDKRRRAQETRERNDMMKRRKQRRALQEVLFEADQPLKPEELFDKAGFEPQSAEDFYTELREEFRGNRVEEFRPNHKDVYLRAIKE